MVSRRACAGQQLQPVGGRRGEACVLMVSRRVGAHQLQPRVWETGVCAVGRVHWWSFTRLDTINTHIGGRSHVWRVAGHAGR